MNSRERVALDRHITGNYGEDQLRQEPLTLFDLMLESANVTTELAAAAAAQKRGEDVKIRCNSIAMQMEELEIKIREHE